jgi:gluconolactonase
MTHEALHPDFRRLIDEGAPVRRIGTGFDFTEGPIWHPVEASPAVFRHARRRAPEMGRRAVTEVMRPSHKGNGMTYDAELNLIVCEHSTSSVARFRPDGTARCCAAISRGAS